VNVGSLFSGIGGFDLGFERAGMRVSWQIELDPFCRAVLARHFPDAARFEDVREVGARELDPVDLICGGFPCQDLSSAGRGAGIDGARSGLWSEFARIVRELRPRYVVVENVPALLTGKGKRWDRGPIGRVLGDLAEARYDAEWACLSAREFGAPHLRKRVWIVAYPQGEPERPGLRPEEPEAERRGRPGDGGRAGGTAQDARRPVDNPDRRGHRAPQAEVCPGRDGALGAGWWATEPSVGRVADGVPDRVDRLAALGNALVPQIAEWIGRRILEYERAARREPVS